MRVARGWTAIRHRRIVLQVKLVETSIFTRQIMRGNSGGARIIIPGGSDPETDFAQLARVVKEEFG